MSKSIITLLCIWVFSLSVKAEQPIFTITSLDANHGQIVDIDFHVDNFTDIISAQFSVNWDPAVIKFRTLKNFNTNVPGLNSSVFGTSQSMLDQGIFTFAWFESSITPITIPDGSLFFTVEFEVLGDPCDHTSISITDNPTEIVVAEEGENKVGLVAINGEVNVPGTGCTQSIELIGNSVAGGCGSNVCVQFTVNNFVDVGVMEFSLAYNPDVLQFTQFQNFAPLQGFGAGNVNPSAPGELRVVWFNGNVENESLPDGTILFEICFNVIGTGGQSSTITFGNNPPPTFSDTDENVYQVEITPAQITAQCALEGFALIADTVCTQPGTIICMDIKVNDFDDIVAMQFSMNWDSTKFIFHHVQGFGLTGLDESGFGTPDNSAEVKQGQLTLSWIDLTLNGQSLPDYTTIFQLCLEAVGPVSTSTPVNFTSNPLEIEIATLDSVLVYSLVQGQAQIKQNCEIAPCTISYVLNTLNPTCPGTSNGVLNLQVTEDCTEAPTYLWSAGGATTEDLTGQPAGIYTVTITVGTQSIIAMATLIDPLPFGVTSNITNPNPPGSATGCIDISVTGGTNPYHFIWSNGATSEDICNLSLGTYCVTITDNNGCTFVPACFVVGAELTAGVNDVSCFGGANGSINLTVAYGTPPYSFVWNTVPQRTTEDIDNLRVGTYCVTVTDNTGATRDSCFVVHQPAMPITATATVTHDTDQNCQGAIDLNITGGTPPYGYHWSNNGSSQDIFALCVGQYCVTVTDGKGCVLDTCFNVSTGGFNVSLQAQQHGNFQVSCNGSCDGQITSTVSGGQSPYNYHWNNSTSNTSLNNVCAGTYSITVTDAAGQTATASIVITEPNAITLDVTTTLPTDIGSNDAAASVVVNGGSPPYTIHWDGPVDFDGAGGNNLPAGSYSLTVIDVNDCEKTVPVNLFPDNAPCYKSISVITPNSDGKNDFFIINCALDDPNHLYIFNRQGGLVYETINYDNTWIGIDQNDEPLPDGGYLWVLEVFGPNHTTNLYKGAVVLLRTAD